MNKTFRLVSEQVVENAFAFARANWKALSQSKHPLVVDFHPETKKRSNAANRYYRAVLVQIQDDAWVEGQQYLAETWHEHFKAKFGKLMPLPGGSFYRTTVMDDDEFIEFVAKVEVYAQQELGVSLLTIAEPLGRTA